MYEHLDVFHHYAACTIILYLENFLSCHDLSDNAMCDLLQMHPT